MAAAVAWQVSGGTGFLVGLAIGAGWIVGDLADRLLVARGAASPAALERLGRWTWAVLGAAVLGLGLFLLVAFFLTGQPIVLVGALVAVLGGALLLKMQLS